MAADTTVALGSEAKLYFCTAGIGGTPVWTEVPEVQNLTLGLTKTSSNVTVRGNGAFQAMKGAVKVASIEFDMPYVRGNANLVQFVSSYISGAVLGLAVMDEDITTSGATGFWADCEVMEFQRVEDVDKTMTAKFKAEPTYPTATAGVLNAPAWKTIT